MIIDEDEDIDNCYGKDEVVNFEFYFELLMSGIVMSLVVKM